eukprot:TRINITY_DN75374_c0_g1_i1.p1 TRINITY_DN75374_c0_g1~~TRINITY_DN75374_c0_g1_i1.p1  ORF type:complete len:498 (-),score=66.45 TRINITY_DN75374_c0_g1_i1:146-1639(-)
MRRNTFAGLGEYIVGVNSSCGHKIPLAMYRDNRTRLLKRLSDNGIKDGLILIQGGEEEMNYDTDTGLRVFRQEAYFAWLFGVQESSFYGTIDVATGNTKLFCPVLGQDFARVFGQIYPTEFFTKKYGVDETVAVDNMSDTLKQLKPKVVYLLKGTNTDSGLVAKPANFEGLAENFKLDYDTLFPHIAEARVFKSEMELDVLRHASLGSSKAHIKAMKSAHQGVGEHEIESTLLHEAYSKYGLRHLGYTAIVCSGYDCAVLHYLPNDKDAPPDSLFLVDFGTEYQLYTADITTTWPASGKFTPQQKAIYNIVLDANLSVMKSMKPGTSWPDMQTLAYNIIGNGLVGLGLLKGDVKDLIENDIVFLFMPHGLGHFLGMAVHDVGGYNPGTPERIMKPGYQHLRTARVLEKGMVLTVEPGCYFNTAMLEQAFKDPAKNKYLNEAEIRKYWDFGGVRIEENVVVLDDGIENMTSVPRTVEEIEKVMAGTLEWECKSTFYKN